MTAHQVYGCSEGLLFTVTAPLDDPETEVGVGVLLPHAELKVMIYTQTDRSRLSILAFLSFLMGTVIGLI